MGKLLSHTTNVRTYHTLLFWFYIEVTIFDLAMISTNG